MDPVDVSHIVSSAELLHAQQLVAFLSRPQPLLAFPEFNSQQRQTSKNVSKRKEVANNGGAAPGGTDVFSRLLKDVEVALEMEHEELEMKRQMEIDHAATYGITTATQDSATQSTKKRGRSASSESESSSRSSSSHSSSSSDRDDGVRSRKRTKNLLGSHKKRTNCADFLMSLSTADLERIISRRLGNVALMQVKEFISKASSTLNDLTAHISELTADILRSVAQQRTSEVPYDVHVCFLSSEPASFQQSTDSLSYTVACNARRGRSAASSVSVTLPSSDLFFCEIVVRDREQLEMRNEKEAYNAYLQMSTAADGQTVENTKAFWDSVLTTSSLPLADTPEGGGFLEGNQSSGLLLRNHEKAKADCSDEQMGAFHVSLSDVTVEGGSGHGEETSATAPIVRGSRRAQSSADLASSDARLESGVDYRPHMVRDGIVQPEQRANASASASNTKGATRFNGTKLTNAGRSAIRNSERSVEKTSSSAPRQSLFGLVAVFYLSYTGIVYSAYLRPDMLPADERSHSRDSSKADCTSNPIKPQGTEGESDASSLPLDKKKQHVALQTAYPLKCATADSFVRNLLRL